MGRHGSTRPRLRVRQGVLFVLAIGLPCLVLVALSLRMIAQERELAEKRLADERRRIVVDVRQQLRSRLDPLRLQAMNGALRNTPAAPEENGAVAFVAAIKRDRLVLPWDSQPDAAAAMTALTDPPFATAVRDGEREELMERRLEAAVASYRRALGAARVPAQTALAQLLVARALEKTGQTHEASSLYRHLLSTTPLVVDEHGVPFALYAARRMLDIPEPETSDLTGVFEALSAIVKQPRRLAPAAVFMMRDVAETLAMRLAASSNAEAASVLVRSIDAMARDSNRRSRSRRRSLL